MVLQTDNNNAGYLQAVAYNWSGGTMNILGSVGLPTSGTYTLNFTADLDTTHICIVTGVDTTVDFTVLIASMAKFVTQTVNVPNIVIAVPSKYRFGNDAQEKVDEVAGIGNHYTAQYWEYDPRDIRRWNTDPVLKPWEGAYVSFSDNPIIYSDLLGNDARTANQTSPANANNASNQNNPNGNSSSTNSSTPNNNSGVNNSIGTSQEESQALSISTVVHVKGGTQEQRNKFIEDANKYLKDHPENLLGTYEENGKKFTVTLNIKYVEKGSEEFTYGDNTMDISKNTEKGRSNVINGRDLENVNGKTLVTTGNFATMRGGADGFTAFHETLHMMGLTDRYTDVDNFSRQIAHPGYSHDAMGLGNKYHATMSQNHWDNWGKAVIQTGKSQDVLRHAVDVNVDQNMRKTLIPEGTLIINNRRN